DSPAEAAVLADQALELAIDVSEELSIFHADLLISRRRATGHFVKHIFGCNAETSVANQRYREVLMSQFDYAVVPINWRQMQPAEGAIDFSITDGWIEALSKKRMPIILGPLLRLDEEHIPDWMTIWE